MDVIEILAMNCEALIAEATPRSTGQALVSVTKSLLDIVQGRVPITEMHSITQRCQAVYDTYSGSVTKQFLSSAPPVAIRNAQYEFDSLTLDDVRAMVALHTTPATDHKSINQGNGVFVGHGHSKLFNEVLRYLTEDFGIEARYFENCSISGEQVIPSLQRMLDECGFAVIVATAEDESEDGIRARQNVVHETGLFQGRLGFERVAILKQVGVAHYSNLSGLLDIPFLGEGIDATFHKLGKQLRKFGYKQI